MYVALGESVRESGRSGPLLYARSSSPDPGRQFVRTDLKFEQTM